MKDYSNWETEELESHLKALDSVSLTPVGSMSTMFALDVIDSKIHISKELRNRT